jgi:transposase InsO family protein
MAVDYPAYGQVRAANELKKSGTIISPGGIRSIWLRHDMETFQKRLKALEAKMAQDNFILTEEQVRALERAKLEKEAHGEIETEHPGYLCSQDTYYVGTIKGIGRIYQQTFIDTYSKVGAAKVYTEKTAITAADMLNDKAIPLFAEHGLPILRILTDRGTEYCGKLENHAYQLYLGIEGIDHSKTKARHPQTNGICERFNRTIKHEFYEVMFRKKIYTSLDAIQEDLDKWIRVYNEERPHSGKFCYGKTPMQTFIDTKRIALEKQYGYDLEKSDSMTYLTEVA